MESRLLETLEAIQQMAARLVATSPAGEGLRLVGGLRYRLLDGSCRSSLDIDYHWPGDLRKRRDELLAFLEQTFTQDRDLLDLFLFRGELPPDARSRLGKKLATLSVPRRKIEQQLRALYDAADVHARGVDRIIQEQVDRPAAVNLSAAGGGKMVCEAVLARLGKLLGKARR